MMKSLRIRELLLLLVLCGLWSCEENIKEITPESEHSWERKSISVSDSENLGKILDDIMSSTSGARIESAFGELDQTEVAMIKFDSLERYGLLFKNDDLFSFSNLVIQDINGEVTSRIIRQVPDPDWIISHDEEIIWKNFTGSIEVYDIEGYLLSSTDMENGLSVDYYNGRVEDQVCTQTVIWQITVEAGGHSYTTYEYGTDCFFTGDNNLYSSSGGGTGTSGSGGSSGTRGSTGGNTTHDSNIDCSTTGNEECPDAPDNPVPVRTITIDIGELKRLLSVKPIKEYLNKCAGVSDMWNSYPQNETSGYLTQDGKIILTDIASFNGGKVQGLYEYNGVDYYASNGKPSLNYAGMTRVGRTNYYLIPVVASIHTHSPCRSDGTNGVSHNVGPDDRNRARANPGINHWVIGCGAVAQFDGSNPNFFNTKSGSLGSICNSIN